MDQALLTRCPHCRTLFQVRQEDLNIANGEVRCGICLQVFNATIGGPDDENSSPADQATQTIAVSEQPRQSSKVKPESWDPEHHHGENSFAVTANEKAIPLLDQKLIPTDKEINALKIEMESIDSILSQKSHPLGRQFSLWLLLSLAAALLLASQWAWFNKSELSQRPELRPWYSLICSTLNCTIPTYRATQKIRIEGLTIRAIPDQTRLLKVDLIIINEGDFRQALPGLILQFFNLDQKLLAQRNFQPAEYLQQSSHRQYLPVNIALHISFSILDPGDNAINYAVQLTPSGNSG